MKSVGIDVGSLTTKVVIMEDSRVLSSLVVASDDEAEAVARKALEQALLQAGLTLDKDLYIVATGVGAKSVSFSQQQKAITTCLARGVSLLLPTVRMAIDMGAESSTLV